MEIDFFFAIRLSTKDEEATLYLKKKITKIDQNSIFCFFEKLTGLAKLNMFHFFFWTFVVPNDHFIRLFIWDSFQFNEYELLRNFSTTYIPPYTSIYIYMVNSHETKKKIYIYIIAWDTANKWRIEWEERERETSVSHVKVFDYELSAFGRTTQNE